jgi:hypothetical protein
MQCTKCHSDNTQRLEVIFDHGTQNISTTSHTSGTVAGNTPGVVTGTTFTQGVSQSNMAAKAAPPYRKSYRAGAFLIFIGFACLNTRDHPALFFLLFAGAGGYLVHRARTYNKTVWPGLYKHWEESWLCNKCGNIYHQA